METWESFLFEASVYCTVHVRTQECLKHLPSPPEKRGLHVGVRRAEGTSRPFPIQPWVLREEDRRAEGGNSRSLGTSHGKGKSPKIGQSLREFG